MHAHGLAAHVAPVRRHCYAAHRAGSSQHAAATLTENPFIPPRNAVRTSTETPDASSCRLTKLKIVSQKWTAH